MLRPAVFLDRDGVLVRNVPRDGRWLSPRTLDQFAFYDDAADGVRALREAGFVAVVATNQPDIGNGLMLAETLAAMHALLTRSLRVDAIFTCPHSQAAGCDCRKPKPGLLLRAADELELDLAKSWMVGDRAGDIEAGRAAGCRGVFIDRQTGGPGSSAPDAIAAALSEAVAFILGRSQHGG